MQTQQVRVPSLHAFRIEGRDMKAKHPTKAALARSLGVEERLVHVSRDRTGNFYAQVRHPEAGTFRASLPRQARKPGQFWSLLSKWKGAS